MRKLSIFLFVSLFFPSFAVAQGLLVKEGVTTLVTSTTKSAAEAAATSSVTHEVMSTVVQAQLARDLATPPVAAIISPTADKAAVNMLPSKTAQEIQIQTRLLKKANQMSLNYSQFAQKSEYITPALVEKYREDALILKNLKSRLHKETYLQEQSPALFNAMEKNMNFIRQNLDPWFYYAQQGNGIGRMLNSNEIREFGNILHDITVQADLLLKQFPNSNYLLNLKIYYAYYWGTVVPTAKPNLKLARQDTRVYNNREFELYNENDTPYYLDGAETMIVDDGEDISEREVIMRFRRAQKLANSAEFQEEAAALREQMPQNLRIAVINDDPTPFRGWAEQNKLAPGTTVTNFKNGHDFIYALKHGQKFDLILNDDEGINSGIKMMLPLRMYAPNTPVFAVTKYEPDTAHTFDYFNADMDGYLWYNSTLAESSIGYVEFMRGVNNYFRMKTTNPSWVRNSEK